ncbi:hypothetical protein QTN47_09115 [Danxiaibacter flavus]|uniref:DUF2292 domain-containing protein n=1 Tax=Danxiaibacter flavus TaxID=3049108 RepID=A0ABV3ZDI8_9BACT|nr:hypothetical protein QNM32_09115 [Chitinophagaceae bacterium DXS]
MTKTEIKEKILKGGQLAIDRLLEKKRKDDAVVVISEKGKVVRVPAKELKK